MNRKMIKEEAKRRGCSVNELIALAPANDPFYCGGKYQIADAKWFQALWDRFQFPVGVHLRRIHYRLTAPDQDPILSRDGLLYKNSDDCWIRLGLAAKFARYLELVDPDAFDDRRNPPAEIYIPEETKAAYQWTSGESVSESANLPDFPELPRLEIESPSADQYYHLEVWCEKSTMNDELRPICQRFKANMVTGLGEMSITSVRLLLNRIEATGKPTRIFYISDFDPAGLSMPVAVSRKIEFWEGDLDIKLFPVMLTFEQCIEYELPRTLCFRWTKSRTSRLLNVPRAG